MRVALATCSAFPRCDRDEQQFIAALGSRGVEATVAVWDDPGVRWDAFDLTMVRDTWDYCERRGAFLDWAQRVPRLHNPAPVLEWNTDKRYLRELAGSGIPVVPTQWIEDADDLPRLRLPPTDVVVKPVVSAGSRNTERYAVSEHEQALRHVRRLLREGRAVMVQPYVASVDTEGETALVFFDGAFSHAVQKAAILVRPNPAGDDLFAAETITPRRPTPAQLRVAHAALAALPWPPSTLLYARVDLVAGDDGGPLVLEVELAEPSLFFSHDAAAPQRAVEAVVARNFR